MTPYEQLVAMVDQINELRADLQKLEKIIQEADLRIHNVSNEIQKHLTAMELDQHKTRKRLEHPKPLGGQ